MEAISAEKALEEVTGLLGPDAEILRADKVQRGGIGGFFAKEVVQLTARRRDAGGSGRGSPESPRGPAAPTAPATTAPAGQPPVPAAPAAPAPSIQSPAPAVPAGPARAPHAPASAPVWAGGANGLLDPFAEALSRFLSETTDADVPAARLLAGAEPTIRPSVPFTPAALEASASPPSAPSPTATRPEAPASQPSAPSQARAAPDAVVLDLPAAPSTPGAPTPGASTPGAPAPDTPAAAPTPDSPAPRSAGVDTPSAAVEPGSPTSATPSSDVAAGPGSLATPAPGSGAAAGGSAAPGTGSPDWSAEGLLRLGLPVSLVRPVIETPPSTDAAWIEAVSRSVAHLCGPLAEEPQLVAGPRAHLLAEPLRLPQADYPDTPPATGSAVMALHVPTADLGLVQRLLGDRRLHLVAGGEGWERLGALRPALVSWVGAEALPAALAFCASRGLTLGYGQAGAGAPTFHATSLDVALALRDLMGRR